MGKDQPKLLVICGPTATGKTELALQLISNMASGRKQFNAEIISADSRQVYIGMDIGTGKDKPTDPNTKIWGYDLVNPSVEFSVSHYQKFAREKIHDIWNRNKLPILVGGSGFYIRAVVDGVKNIDVTVDSYLREKLEGKSAFELFNMLAKINPERAQKMNISDRNNPRRLIRAIEIYSAVGDDGDYQDTDKLESNNLFVGLTTKSDVIKKRIVKRVNKRLKQGMGQEVESLLRSGVTFEHQAMSTPGYKQWQGYLKDEYGIEKLKEDWIAAESQYAKRQMTWFKRDQRIMWFDIGQPDIYEKVADVVKKWYIKSKDKHSLITYEQES